MAQFASDMASLVLNLLTEYGNSGQLTQVTTGSYDPLQGTTVDTEVNIPVKFISLDNSEASYALSSMLGEGMGGFSKDKVMIPAVNGVTIDNTWKMNGKLVEDVETISIQDTIVAYNLTLESK